MKYKKSIFLKTLNNKDKYLLFNASTLKYFSADEEDIQYINKYDEPRELESNPNNKSLLDAGFLVEASLNEEKVALKKCDARMSCAKRIRENTIGYMRISLTEKCNLKCKYCFVNKIHDAKDNMSIENFEEMMKKFILNNKRPVVQYFGGEPLLRMDLIKRGHELLQASKDAGEIEFFTEEIVTNGTLVTDEIAKYLVDNDIEISFSIDGWKEIHDLNRVDHKGNGSYDLVVKGMETYSKAGGRLIAIVTPTNENVHIFGDIIRYLVEELCFTEISINTPQPQENGWHVDGKDFAEAIKKCWDFCDKKNIALNHPGNNIAFLVNNQIPQTNSCMNLSYGKDINTWGIYVTSDLRISKCVVECDERCTKKVNDFKFDDEYIDWHFQNNRSEQCTKCIGFNICGGPCSIESLLADNKVNKEKCKFFKTLIPWVLGKVD